MLNGPVQAIYSGSENLWHHPVYFGRVCLLDQDHRHRVRLAASRLTTFSLGFLLPAAYMTAQILRIAGLPLISGYIFVGILAGPYMTGFLTHDMVARFRLVDDLALSFIALTAGGTLQLQFLRKRGKAIAINILLLTLVVFAVVFFSFFS